MEISKVVIENKHFSIYVINSELVIDRTDTKTLDYVFYDELSATAIWGDAKNPRRVVRMLMKSVVEYIYEHNINYFYFTASEDSRISLYNRLSKILTAKLNMIYHVEEFKNSSTYYFYKSSK